MLRVLYLIFALSGFLPSATVVMAADAPTVLVWGDSLSAAYGIPVDKGWVNLLQEKLSDNYRVVNGSISGETSAGGLTRLPEALKTHQPAYLLLELGANDGLRGIDLPTMRSNLEAMLKLAQAANAKVILLGIQLPPNYGSTFTEKFAAIYTDLAKQYNAQLVPFLLDGVADNWDLMQADGLHPTAEAQPKVLENVWKVLETVLPAH
jgi:acyl-CoA thioesterase-1